MLKGQKGITLVALVVTIVILIILAGVSISLILGDDGLIGRAKNARTTQETAQNKETGELTNVVEWLNNNGY